MNVGDRYSNDVFCPFTLHSQYVLITRGGHPELSHGINEDFIKSVYGKISDNQLRSSFAAIDFFFSRHVKRRRMKSVTELRISFQ